MDNGFVCYDILKDRVSHGDIVSLYNRNPDWPSQKLLIVKDESDAVIKCVHLEMPLANLSIRCKWNDIAERSSQPVTMAGNHVTYNCFRNSFHQTQCLYATVRLDSLCDVIENGLGKIDNQQPEAEDMKNSGNKSIRIPDRSDISQYMREALSSVGTAIAFDPVFANCEHWATMKRYNVSWSKQVHGIITDEGVWKFILLIVRGGEAVVSHFFRSFGEYRNTPLGRQALPLVNTVLPAVEMFIAEVSTLRREFQLTTASFRTLCTAGSAIGVIVSVLMWFWASLRDIVTSPKETIIASDAQLRKAYESIDHWPVVCNMASMTTSLVNKAWNRFVNWLLNFAAKILLSLEGGMRSIQS